MCDTNRHIVLFVGVNKGTTYFVAKDKKEVGVHKLPTGKFEEVYNLEYTEYPLADYANRTLGLQQYGVIIASRARVHLRAIIEKEPAMAKPTAPVSTKAAPVVDPKAKAVKPAAAAPEAKTKVAKEPKEPKAEGATRERREKLNGASKIKVIGKNTARVGSTRHSIVETILAARTVAEALDSTVSRKDGTEYKIGTPDLYFALENNLIELVG